MNDERVENKIRMFNDKDSEHFHLWALSIKTALRRRELLSAIIDKENGKMKNEKALSLIVSVLDDKPLRAVQVCENGSDVGDKVWKGIPAKW